MENDVVIVANCFADYFVNVAEGNMCMMFVRRISNITQALSLQTRKQHDVALDFYFQAIPEKDVSDVLENIIPRRSLGWDSPTVPTLLKKTASAIAPSLGATLKDCIDEGSYPTKWKMEEWTPVFRKGDKQEKENYRPITVQYFQYLAKCSSINCTEN